MAAPARSASSFPASFSLTVNTADLARVTKNLDKYQGAELAKRTDKAIQAGLKLLINPIRAGAARHRVTGKTEKSVKVTKLRKRPGEIVAYKVGVNTWYGHFVIAGVYGHEGDSYVDAAMNELGGEVQSFIDEQVIRLA